MLLLPHCLRIRKFGQVRRVNLVESVRQPAVVHAVEEIERHRAQHEPGEEDEDARLDREDQTETGQYAQRRQYRIERHLEAARQFRVRRPQPDHRQADDAECRERADRGHVAERVDVEHAGRRRGDEADDDGIDPRRLEFLVDGRENARQQPVARHRVEDAGLAVHQHQHDRGQADNRAGLDDLREPQPFLAERIDGDGDRIRNVEVLVVDDQRQHDRHQYVENGADDQRTDDADRHVLLRVARLLTGGRDRLESDIGEEHDRRGTEDAAPAELALFAGRFRNERLPVRRQRVPVLHHHPAADDDEGDDDAGLDGNDDVVDLGRFRNAKDKQPGKRDADHEGRQVEDSDDAAVAERLAVGASHALLNFTRQLIYFRRQHPIFQQRKWFQGRAIHGSGVHDIAWFNPDGGEMTESQWHDGFTKAIGIFLNGEEIATRGERGERIMDDSFLLFFNAHHDPVEFLIPSGLQHREWRVVIDTNQPRFVEAEICYKGDKPIPLEARSVVVLQRR